MDQTSTSSISLESGRQGERDGGVYYTLRDLSQFYVTVAFAFKVVIGVLYDNIIE